MATYTRCVTAYVPGKNPWTHRVRTFYNKEHTKKRSDGFAIMINNKIVNHGLLTTWHENGHLIKTDQFYKGIQTGTTTMFRIDGTMFGQVTYKNGLKHGWTANFDHNGKTMLNQTQWLNNMRRRDYIYFKDMISSTGKKVIKEVIDYYANNKIKQKSIFDKDSLYATHYIFYESGNPHFIINEEKISANKYKGHLKDSTVKQLWVLSGPQEIYYPDGILKIRLFYNNGREDKMLRRQYDSNGKQLLYPKTELLKIPNYTEILKPLEIN